MRIHFENCCFDSETHEVFRSGRPVPLSPKAFHLLQILIRERPKAVARETVHGELWPGVFVTEANLPNLVTELRSALGDDARRSRIIRTVRGFGYAFGAQARETPAEALPPGPAYRLIWGNREIALEPGENVIGRVKDTVVWIDHTSVSRHHARILVGAEGAVLEDLGSKNGTVLKQSRISKPTALSDGDAIEIGPARLVFRVFHHTGTTSTSRSTGVGAGGPRAPRRRT
jgi:DNA-binding winged helix-turn-helix (wHTH) protein